MNFPKSRSGRSLAQMSGLAVLVACAVSISTFAPPARADGIHVDSARIGCLDIQHRPNLTALVERRCEGKTTCNYKAPTPAQYHAARVKAKTRSFCTQAMDITYDCGDGRHHTAHVEGDAWKHPPAYLKCPKTMARTQPPRPRPQPRGRKPARLIPGVRIPVQQATRLSMSPHSPAQQHELQVERQQIAARMRGQLYVCKGPDPRPRLVIGTIKKVGAYDYKIDLWLIVQNAGRSTYRGGARQQGLWLSDNQSSKLLYSGPWPRAFGYSYASLPPKKFVFLTKTMDYTLRPGDEFPVAYTLSLNYDPDIASDGNPGNDDCDLGDNRFTLTARDIRQAIESRVAGH